MKAIVNYIISVFECIAIGGALVLLAALLVLLSPALSFFMLEKD